jgi:hypothetical protein
MRRYTKALLLMLVALLYAGTASAHVISIMEGGDTVVSPLSASDMLTVDVMLDNEGAAFKAVAMYVNWDPALLSASAGASVKYAVPGETGSSFYLYPSGDNWYMGSRNFSSPIGPVNQSLATLVFHVIQDVASTTELVIPSFDFGPFGGFVSDTDANITGQVGLVALHVPEPTTTMLMGLGLLGILYAGRRR